MTKFVNHIPKFATPDIRREYLRDHLGNELHWLLRAATEWHVQNTLKLNIPGYHMQVYAMDSAFLHARALFEFFSKNKSGNYYGWDDFVSNKPNGNLYPGDWSNPLHSNMMHAQDRSTPKQLTSIDGTTKKDLNQMPLEFAKEIVSLWRDFIGVLSEEDLTASKTAQQVLDKAIEGAQAVLINEITTQTLENKQVKIVPIIW